MIKIRKPYNLIFHTHFEGDEVQKTLFDFIAEDEEFEDIQDIANN